MFEQRKIKFFKYVQTKKTEITEWAINKCWDCAERTIPALSQITKYLPRKKKKFYSVFNFKRLF